MTKEEFLRRFKEENINLEDYMLILDKISNLN